MMISGLLFYRKLLVDLEAYRFKINPYDPCTANMEVGGSQMNVVWHVDDLKVSHKKAFEITKLAGYLDNIYPGLKVNYGKVHHYLGMNLNFSVIFQNCYVTSPHHQQLTICLGCTQMMRRDCSRRNRPSRSTTL